MLRKILFAVLGLLLLALGIGYAWLNRELPLEMPDLKGLQRHESASIPAAAAAPLQAASGRNLRTKGRWFAAPDGRAMLLRGVNLGGSTKVPFSPSQPTHVREGFFEGNTVSFVGRPFPLEEADAHFARLRAWGFHFVRFLITWEAVEHAGPGQYDEAYLEYVYQIAKKAGEYGINLFIDPHQDVFSRFTGGDGAPMWIFGKMGMDVERFHETGTAIVHNLHGDPFPRMIWPTNYSKFAAATMFTLFFAGDAYAPETRIDGQPVQAYLQGHYLEAIRQVALRLRGLPNVVGFDTFNEPTSGYIGVADLNAAGGLLQVGDSPTYFQGMLLAAGIPQEVPVYELQLTGPAETSRKLLNPEGKAVWLPGAQDIWRQHGVWELDANGQPRLLKADYFAKRGGDSVQFSEMFFRPFAERYAAMLREADSAYLVFVDPALGHPIPDWTGADTRSYVHAPHWYDALTLFTKQYSPYLGLDVHTRGVVLGRREVQESFIRQFEAYLEESNTHLNGQPTLIGEVGIPYDMNGRKAYETGDYTVHAEAMDRSIRAMEANLLHYTLWNYTADNTHERGDQWNGEDLSIYSPDDRKDPADVSSGGRALDAVVRPYPYRVAGEPLQSQFAYRERSYVFRWRPDPSMQMPTELFLPAWTYGSQFEVLATPGCTLGWDEAARMLLVTPPAGAAEATVWVRRPE